MTRTSASSAHASLCSVPPPEASVSALATRSRVLRAIRAYFAAGDFVEVETPVRLPTPALELHIDAEPAGGCFLRTSPELHMKRLLTRGCERIFQMGPCFRQGEVGRQHRPEFTMLEWYRTGADYMDVLSDAQALVASVFHDVTGRQALDYAGHTVDVTQPWHVLSVRDAFVRAAGWDPVAAFDADRFDLDLVEKVEPSLPDDRPVVLMDYPAAVAALARRKPDRPDVAERWELYIGGMELANAFTELTDPREQRQRFLQCAQQRGELGREVYPLDEAFLAALESGLPRCGGVALGVDRLVMLVTGAGTIDEVRPF